MELQSSRPKLRGVYAAYAKEGTTTVSRYLKNPHRMYKTEFSLQSVHFVPIMNVPGDTQDCSRGRRLSLTAVGGIVCKYI